MMKGIEPTPLAKPRKPRPKEDPKQKGKGKGKGKSNCDSKGEGKGTFPAKTDLDYEHAGVAIAINQRWLKNLEEVKEVSRRIIVLEFKGAGGDIAFLSAYAPTADSKGKDRTNSMIHK